MDQKLAGDWLRGKASNSEDATNNQKEKQVLSRARQVARSKKREARSKDGVSVKAGCLESFDLRGSKGKTAVHIWIKEAIVDIPEGAEAYEGEPRDD
jgi:hypothetical protein